MTILNDFIFYEDIYINSEYVLDQWDHITVGTFRPKDPFSIPVRLSADAGLIREWRSRINEHQTGITIRAAKDEETPQTINGTLVNFQYTEEFLVSRQPFASSLSVPIELFKPLAWQSLPNVPFVKVVQHNATAPVDMHNPILQSYLDICLKGCLEYGEEFAVEFLETTVGWSKFWVNDRSLPRRPWVHEKRYKILDELLAQYPSHNNFFNERKLDSEYSVYFVKDKLNEAKSSPKYEHPKIPRFDLKLKEQVVHFIFGFGSLINHNSRRQTNPESKDAIPVRVAPEFGYIRSWNYHGTSSKLTALGVREIENGEDAHSINGVIYPVNGTDMSLVDEREDGYKRVEVPWRFVESFSWPALPDPDQTKLWMYLPENPQHPNSEYPVLQTYVDVCLDGCLEYGEEFAKEFLESTFGWSQFWLNDRLLARRPWIHCPNHQLIDRLLEEHPKTGNTAHQRKLSVEYAVNFIDTDMSKD